MIFVAYIRCSCMLLGGSPPPCCLSPNSKLHFFSTSQQHFPPQLTLTPPLHHSNTPSTNFHTPLLVLYSSLATVPSGNRISLLFRFISAGRSKNARAMSVCSCFEKVGLGLYGGGVFWRERAVRQAGQCLEGRVKERI